MYTLTLDRDRTLAMHHCWTDRIDAESAAEEVPDARFREVDRIRHELHDAFEFMCDPETMMKDRMLNWLMRTLLVERSVLDQARQSGVVLLGGAVHAEPILGGPGANEAIEDGIRLAEVLVQGGGKSPVDFYGERVEALGEGCGGEGEAYRWSA